MLRALFVNSDNDAAQAHSIYTGEPRQYQLVLLVLTVLVLKVLVLIVLVLIVLVLKVLVLVLTVL